MRQKSARDARAPDVIDVQMLTHDQPFCAGVIILEDGCLLATLNIDGLPLHLRDAAWRVGGVGGGQEAGETMIACAQREAREELCVSVRLASAPITYLHDIDSGEILSMHCHDAIAPFLFQRQRNPSPDKPYRPGLPTGSDLFFGLYLAQPAHPAAVQPGDDVQGLLRMPVELWPLPDCAVKPLALDMGI